MAELQDRWLSVDEICQHLGVSSDTVYRWIDRSEMPAHKMGRKWKFKREQVDAPGSKPVALPPTRRARGTPTPRAGTDDLTTS